LVVLTEGVTEREQAWEEKGADEVPEIVRRLRSSATFFAIRQ